MSLVSTEDGLRVVDGDDGPGGPVPDDDGHDATPSRTTGLETLRDAFVDAFNARDLDALLALVSADVDCPDTGGEGRAVLAEELESIWERSPSAFLTAAELDEEPCAIAWMPDEDGCWSRAAVVCFDTTDEGLIGLVTIPDDVDSLDRAVADEPTGEELEEWSDWSEWDRGEETVARPRDRARP